jgi:hypothetical protein
LSVRLIVIAKAPVAGRSKTRLCPPCTPEQAAELAEAALVDTLDAVAATPCAERIIALDGTPGVWLPPGFEVVEQCGGGLGERLAHAFSAHDGPTLLIGMDTPQVDRGLLEQTIAALSRPGADAVLGLAEDGGYWAIGFRRPDPRAFDGVPMSTEETGVSQYRALRRLGLRVGPLPVLRDVDRIEDARAVAAAAPAGSFARALDQVEASLCVI